MVELTWTKKEVLLKSGYEKMKYADFSKFTAENRQLGSIRLWVWQSD